MNSIEKTYNHQQSSIELDRGKNGAYSWSIKIYFGNGKGTVDEALIELDDIDKKLQAKFLKTYEDKSYSYPAKVKKETKKEEKKANSGNNGWASEKQINYLYAKARRLSGEKLEGALENWLIQQAIENEIISEEKDLKHFSVEEASSLIELLPE
jgi:hypothetical protein